jgi:hypothetical protein
MENRTGLFDDRSSTAFYKLTAQKSSLQSRTIKDFTGRRKRKWYQELQDERTKDIQTEML